MVRASGNTPSDPTQAVLARRTLLKGLAVGAGALALPGGLLSGVADAATSRRPASSTKLSCSFDPTTPTRHPSRHSPPLSPRQRRPQA